MHFSGFVILSLTLQINLPLKLETDNFFVSGQMYKICRESNLFFSPTVVSEAYRNVLQVTEFWWQTVYCFSTNTFPGFIFFTKSGSYT